MNFPYQPIEVRLTFDLSKVTPASCSVPLLHLGTSEEELRGSNLFRIMGCPFRVTASSSFPERVDVSSMGILGRDAQVIAERWLRMTQADRQADMALFRDSNPTLHAAAMAVYNRMVQPLGFPGEEVVSAILLRDVLDRLETARGVTIGDVVTMRGLRQSGIDVLATCGGNSLPERCVPAQQLSWSQDRTGRALVRGLQPHWPTEGVVSINHFGGQPELILGDYPGIGSVYNYVTTEMEYSSADLANTATLFLSMRGRDLPYSVNPQRGWVTEEARREAQEQQVRQVVDMVRSGVISQADALRLTTGEAAPQVPPEELFQSYTSFRQREEAFADQILPQEMRTAQTPPLAAQAMARMEAQRQAFISRIGDPQFVEQLATDYSEQYRRGLNVHRPAGTGAPAAGAALVRTAPRPLPEADRRLYGRIVGNPAPAPAPVEERHSEIGRPAGRGVFIDHEVIELAGSAGARRTGRSVGKGRASTGGTGAPVGVWRSLMISLLSGLSGSAASLSQTRKGLSALPSTTKHHFTKRWKTRL